MANARNRPLEQAERDLIQRAIKGDAEAFGQIYDLHADRVFRTVYYRVGDSKEAEDLTQEVFLRAWKALPSYKLTSSPLLAWLMTIAHNLVVDHYRAKRKEPHLDAEMLADDSVSRPDRVAEESLKRQELRQALMKLKPLEQQVVLLHLIEGFPYAEIAPLLGKTAGNLRVIQHRALVKLAKMLERETIDG